MVLNMILFNELWNEVALNASKISIKIVACGRTNIDGRMDGHGLRSFVFAFWLRIYIHVYTYLEYFLYFPPLWPKLDYAFSSGNGYKDVDFLEILIFLQI